MPATSTPRPPPDRLAAGGVLALPWERFVTWFRGQWEPGQHMALIGPTGTGKSTFAVAVLPSRKWVLGLDPKGGDSTLAKLRGHGFDRIERWPPPRKVLRAVEEGEPARLIVGPVVQHRSDLPKLQLALADALDGAFDMGGWTVYVDELQVAADRRMFNLTAKIERNLIAARDKGVTMVSSYQRPANVPRSASEMSRWIAVFYTRDTDVVNRIAEMVGRPKAEIRGAIRALGGALRPGTLLLFSSNPNDPIVVTRPPRAA